MTWSRSGESKSALTYPPGEALLKAYLLRGPVIDAGVSSIGYTLLLGPNANRFVFANADAFSWRETFEILGRVDGRNSLIVSDGADHRRRRGVVAPSMTHRSVSAYIDTMAAHADAVIDTWREGERVDVYPQFRSAIRRSICEALFGRRLAAHADFLGEQFEPLLRLTHAPPQVVSLQYRLGTPAARRALAARARIERLVDRQIAAARRDPQSGDGLLADLINARPAGKPLSDNEIRDLVISLIADGFETTGGALAWAIYALLTVPGAWDTAANEVRDVTNTQDVLSLTYLNGVVHETLRLYTPGVISARKVKNELDFEGHTIRAGRLVIFSPYVTHRLPEIWSEPTLFQPRRWDPASTHYRKPSPYEFIPFSGGEHRCIGSAFAIAEMKVMLAQLLAKTTLRLPEQRVRARNFGALRPVPGLTVEVAAHGTNC